MKSSIIQKFDENLEEIETHLTYIKSNFLYDFLYMFRDIWDSIGRIS